VAYRAACGSARVGSPPVLWFERRVVGALINSTLDAREQAEVESYVDRTLRAMPEFLRAGVAAESVAFGAWPRLQRALGRLDEERLRRRVARWKVSSLDPVRQYVRLLQSLVLFAEHELELADGS
jgi:hypothetical protein